MPRLTAVAALAVALACFHGTARAADPAPPADEARCRALLAENFRTLERAPTQLRSAEVVRPADGQPAYCRIRAYAWPQVGIQLHLPLADWSERLVMLGCGSSCGFLGRIIEDLDRGRAGLAKGYAVAFTDMGHTGVGDDALWAWRNPQAEEDFFHRATHVTAVASKEIARRFYGRPVRRAYIVGTSTGGQQGLMAAQRYPADFDGVFAGCPALDEELSIQLGGLALAAAPGGRTPLRAEHLPILHRAALDRCDARDGLADGVITDPRLCDFDPAVVACRDGQSADCLPPEALAVARALYAGPRFRDGRPINAGGMLPGSELTWSPSLIAPAGGPGGTYAFMEGFFQYIGFDEDPGPAFRLTDLDLDSAPARMTRYRAGRAITDPRFAAFRERGGRIVMLQGWNDFSTPALGNVRWYESVAKAAGGYAAAREYIRLFMMPGVNHCTGGAGADLVDGLSTIEAWVERGVAPERIWAGKAVPDGPSAYRGQVFPLPPESIAFSRPLVPYPDVAVWDGRGDPRQEGSFVRIGPEEFAGRFRAAAARP